jgi:hypothetical protein
MGRLPPRSSSSTTGPKSDPNQFAHIPTKTFYNGGKGSDYVGPTANLKNSLHHWADHGIAARGVLLDYWGYAQANGIHYDPFSKPTPPAPRTS